LSDRPTHFVEGIRNANFIHQEREEGLKAKLELHNICRSINTIIKECDSVQKDEELRNILYSDNFSNLFGPNKEAIKKKRLQIKNEEKMQLNVQRTILDRMKRSQYLA